MDVRVMRERRIDRESDKEEGEMGREEERGT